jgi:conjugative relaxase-like TrwC/TraI family protein
VRRDEAERFATARQAPTVVIGYDLTFSAPKSVSILWVSTGAARQAQIVAALDDAVAAGVAYLEDKAAFIQGPRRYKATGVVAASYLHATSRALDPQLHRHVVVANMAERVDGAFRALDGRPLYARAKVAGYLAAAELRTHPRPSHQPPREPRHVPDEGRRQPGTDPGSRRPDTRGVGRSRQG